MSTNRKDVIGEVKVPDDVLKFGKSSPEVPEIRLFFVLKIQFSSRSNLTPWAPPPTHTNENGAEDDLILTRSL